MRNGSTSRIFRATRATTSGTFAGAAEVGELMSAGSTGEGSLVVSADGLVIYFGSERADGIGQSNIRIARRSTLQDGFGPATNVPNVNSSAIEWPVGLSTDGCRLYLGSNRAGTTGGYDIWVASKPQT